MASHESIQKIDKLIPGDEVIEEQSEEHVESTQQHTQRRNIKPQFKVNKKLRRHYYPTTAHLQHLHRPKRS